MNKQFVAAEICHDRAPLALRQKLNMNEVQLRAQLAGLACDLEEVFILSTRNRFAIYAWARSTAHLEKFFKQFDKNCTHVDFYTKSFSTTKHLFETASGKFSEAHLSGKLNSAYKRAHDAGTIGKALDTVLHEAVNLGKNQSSTFNSQHALNN